MEMESLFKHQHVQSEGGKRDAAGKAKTQRLVAHMEKDPATRGRNEPL